MTLGDYRTITVEQRDGYAELVLNRPEALNALNQDMAEELCEALSRPAGRPGDPARRLYTLLLTASAISVLAWANAWSTAA